MSPAAVDLITLPPLEPPAPVSAPSATSRREPSFRDHLQQAERRTGAAESSHRESKSEDRASPSTEARAPQESGETDEPHDKKSDEPQEPADAVAGTKEKKQEEDADSEQKSDEETGAEIVIAAVAAQQEVEAAAVLKMDVVEISAETAVLADDAAAAAQTAETWAATAAADAATIVVQTAAATPDAENEQEAVAAPTDVAIELETEIAPTAVAEAQSTDGPTKIAPVEPPQSGDFHATQPTAATEILVASVAPAVPVAPAAAALPESDAPSGKEKTETKFEAAASNVTSPADAVVQQVVAAAEAIVDAATGKNDKQPQRRDDDRPDGPRVESRSETTRTDRPHLPEQVRSPHGREVGGSRAATNEDTTQLSQSDRVRLVERVARAVRTAEQRGGDLKIRLSPPELGSLRLQVKLTDGTLSVRIEAETPEARQVLIDNLPALREKLSDQNIRVERFDVDLFNSGHDGAPQQSREEFDQAMFAAGQRRSNRALGSEEKSGGTASRSNSGSLGRNDGRLDITV